jgi:catechol 2,3-dioxygenase-like lactoylglutathione lyase family enzyme
MTATSLNHVSISASHLQESVDFYVELFGLQPVPTPNFGLPVQWMRIGDLQVHLFERPGAAPSHHHLAFTVDDIDQLYEKAKAKQILDDEAFGYHLYELPDNIVQLYVRDPGGNLLELDWPDVNSAGPAVRRDLRPLPNAQNEDNLRSTLFLNKERTPSPLRGGLGGGP